MTVKLHIDGVPVEYELSGTGFYRTGPDINGRICRVSHHIVPLDWLARQRGAMFTGGHRFEFKEVKE